MQQLTLGIMSHTRKENEHRLPVHPAHFDRIAADIRRNIFLESGYGEYFGVTDSALAPLVGGFRSRAELIAECDVILLAKPLHEDLGELREGQVLWGWPHCVQDEKVTQTAIDRRLTVIAFEAMNHWGRGGTFNLHVFHKNNELAGYSSVLHAMQLTGATGDYGRRQRAVVIGFGATARGAVTALSALGVHDVDVLTARGVTAVSSPIHSARIVHFDHDEADDTNDPRRSVALTEDGPVPLAGFLAQHDIIVNCVLQDTDSPLMFLIDDDLPALAPGSLVIDVSCDEGMGFEWARPTTFTDPMFTVGDNVHYYGVDHSPSYLWNSATWENSEALIPYLRPVLEGPAGWDGDETIRRAIEIRGGTVQNPKVLAFQHRSAQYPHPHE
ncbi:N(5)-(carboxyethyl)ornithine synthase [Streptomyces sp. NBC_01198]|uniref:N(5)-(carboxyethyl)ornithine synthase n=1 Tax=Streptomyces sp. NBC_01198 TaxID=2903769 RepID=UPI002E150253|nr:N(5)-(carboxyethyl)ornithine synthase [Streptomyces sp. NBC_01198]